MRANYLVVLTLMIMISACSKTTQIIVIDNPTDQKINVLIDQEKSFELNPFETKEILLLSGNHKMTINEKTEKLKILSGNEYLLNPTLSNYILRQVTYASSKPEDKFLQDVYSQLKENNPELEKIPYDTIEIRGFEIEGNLIKTNDLLIKKIWDFSVNKPLPKQMKSVKKGDDIVKIYREEDFIKELVDSNE